MRIYITDIIEKLNYPQKKKKNYRKNKTLRTVKET